ncbi:GNAT family protein [Spirosoma sp. SC4-14]|uniref:GNAT family N-acetyltransferase n=1 Tax=Spirosoma sp. SC4-14 TaxID=3128900 RepID=UPI0030D38C52
MLTLQPLSPADLAFVIQSEQHPDNQRYVGQWTVEQYRNALDDPNYQCFLIIADGNPVGHCILYDLQNPDNSVLLKRIVIQTKGQGYGRIALENIMAYVFGVLKANRLWLDVRTFNERAEKLYQSIGFQYEGTQRKASHVDQEYVDLKLYGMLREEYNQRTGQAG